ncbi:MAG: hypothetical protein U0802_07720 [Candidatus Binatia bacterium]
MARRGDFVYLPRRARFANTGATTARALVIRRARIEAERFFAEVDATFGGQGPRTSLR